MRAKDEGIIRIGEQYGQRRGGKKIGFLQT